MSKNHKLADGCLTDKLSTTSNAQLSTDCYAGTKQQLNRFEKKASERMKTL